MQAVVEPCLLQEGEGEPVEEGPRGQSWWLMRKQRVTALAQAAEEASSDRQPKY